jgi:hypothetical protein
MRIIEKLAFMVIRVDVQNWVSEGVSISTGPVCVGSIMAHSGSWCSPQRDETRIVTVSKNPSLLLQASDRGVAQDEGALEYVFDAGEAEIAADFMVA